MTVTPENEPRHHDQCGNGQNERAQLREHTGRTVRASHHARVNRLRRMSQQPGRRPTRVGDSPRGYPRLTRPVFLRSSFGASPTLVAIAQGTRSAAPTPQGFAAASSSSGRAAKSPTPEGSTVGVRFVDPLSGHPTNSHQGIQSNAAAPMLLSLTSTLESVSKVQGPTKLPLTVTESTSITTGLSHGESGPAATRQAEQRNADPC